jgi:hypothetical protein
MASHPLVTTEGKCGRSYVFQTSCVHTMAVSAEPLAHMLQRRLCAAAGDGDGRGSAIRQGDSGARPPKGLSKCADFG